ncbi:MFS multidrug transporter [Colletotrichum abscissum]|uniref:MFS multidrug transporter n=1 Tax=Colletotrichum abscissum TaxID=1671311 RepID=A0A9P9XS59_9PEZI|nr:MFS multidrug transporter [Colletotrichum abscissum]
MKGERDVEEAASATNHKAFLSYLYDAAGVTQEVLDWSYQGHGTQSDPFVVEFLVADSANPLQLPSWRKWSITFLQAFAVLAVSFASSSFSSGIPYIVDEFNVSRMVALLGVSLFVIGFALGPLVFAPLSEMFGRQLIFVITFGALTAFNAAAAGSKNIETLLILRFLAGTIGSALLTNAGGVIADMFSADERGLANALFATAPFLGPAVGPIAGGFLSQAKGWRWLQGLMAIFTGVLWVLGSLWVPETYTVVILRLRAEVLSKITGHVYVSKFDVGHPNKALLAELRKALLRPWQLLFLEPIVLLCSIFQAVVFGTLYMMFAAFPIVFQQTRGWFNGVGGLAFLGVAVGMMFAVGYSGYDNIRYIKVNKSYDGGAPPEMRLPPALIGSVLLPIGLLWFAWTNGPNIHWIVPIVGLGFFAAGLVLVFLSLMNYLVDSYVIYAASVLAASSVLRSLFATAFPLFTTNMYHSLGIHWASSVPAFLYLACVPFPFLFFRYGKSIRLRCKYAAQVA